MHAVVDSEPTATTTARTGEAPRARRPHFWRPLLLIFLLLGTLGLLAVVLWFSAARSLATLDDAGNGLRPAYWLAVTARAGLYSVAENERTSVWRLGEAALRYLFDFPLFVIGAGGSRLAHFHGLQMATGGLPAPFFDGYMLFSHKDVSDELMNPGQRRGRYIGAQATPDFCMGAETLIFLSNGERHSLIKTFLVDAIRAFHVDAPAEQALRRAGVQWMGEPALTAADRPDDALVRRYVVSTLYYRMFGAALDPATASLFEGYFTWGGTCVAGRAIDTLTLGRVGQEVTRIRAAGVAAVRETPTGRRVAERVVEHNKNTANGTLDVDEVLTQIVDGYLFAGLFGTTHLTLSTLNRVRANPAAYVPLFRADPESFMVEQARLDPPVTSVTAVLADERVVHLGPGHVGPAGEYVRGGQTVVYPRGATVQLAISTANRDPAVFGKTAHLFQPQRSTLHLALSWNGVWGEVQQGRAPRGCPGHALSLDVARTVVEQFLPRAEQPASGTPAPGDCYERISCADAATPIVYERLRRTPSGYDSFFVGVLILSCLLQLVQVSRVEGPVNATWWWLNWCNVAALCCYLADSLLGVHLCWFWSSWLLLLVVVIVSCQRSTLLGLALSAVVLLVGVFFTLFFAVLSFSLGEAVVPALFRLVFTAHTLIWLLFTFAVLLFPRWPRQRAFALLACLFAVGGALLPTLLPNVGVLFGVVAFLGAQYCLNRTVEALNRHFPNGVTLHTLHYRLPGVLKKALRYAALFAVVYALFAVYRGVHEHADGHVCTDRLDPLCYGAKTAHIDLYTRFLFQNVRDSIEHDSPDMPPASLIAVPKRQIKLPAIEALPFPWYLPFEDEDGDYIHVLAKLKTRLVDDFLHSQLLFPLADDDLAYDSADEGRATLLRAAGALASGVATGNHSNDEAMTRWAFYGLAAHLVRRVPGRSLQRLVVDERELYMVDLLWAHALDVRPGFERFGAAAYFDAELRVTRVVLRRGSGAGVRDVDYLPGSAGWEHAKFAWRSTVLTAVTLKDHLAQTHLKVSSIAVQAARETLPVNHPLRRFLAPFTYRTIEVNRGAASYLCAERGVLHRATALTIKGVLDGFRASLDSPVVWLFHDVEGLEFIPFNQDGRDFHDIVQRFVAGYFDLYYPTDEAVFSDPPLAAFVRKIESFGLDLPEIRQRADVVQLLTHFIITVTGFHHHVGTVSEYVLDPQAATGKIRPHATMADVQASMQTLIIALFTSYKQPALINDFTHLLLRDELLPNATKIFNQFQQELVDFAHVVEERNRHRPWRVDSFNPTHLLSAVSI